MEKMRKRKYLKPESVNVYIAEGEAICIATGSKGTGEALSKGNFNSSDDWDENNDEENSN
jgi:hypothetical protein